MNSDLLKRERIREALTARLLQLSKQCEEICGPPGLPSNEGGFSSTKSENLGVAEFCLSFEDASQAESSPYKSIGTVTALRSSVLPAMINNYVNPRPYSMEQDVNECLDHPPCSEKAFYKTVLQDQYRIFENSFKGPAVSDTVFEAHSESQSVQSDSDSRLLMETPSTDLDHYMTKSVNATESTREQSFSTSSDVSSDTDADHVTVVSLTSDSDSDSHESSKRSEESSELQSSGENILPADEEVLTPFPKVLNELPVVVVKNAPSEQTDGSVKEPDEPLPKTPRRRRLSYTLETPSPVLERALKNCTVGPESVEVKTDSRTISSSVNAGNNLQLHTGSPQHQSSSQEETSVKVPSTDRPVSNRGYFSPKSRIPVINSIRPNISSVLLGFDQQLQNLDSKNQSLRQYLDSMNTASPVLSPEHERKKSCDARPQSRSQSLPLELQSLREELTLQRSLLTEQSQRLQDLSAKQESFFKQILSVQQQQMTQLQVEITRNVQELFAQQNLVVQTRLKNLESIIHKMASTGPQEVFTDKHADFMDGKPDKLVLLPTEDILPKNSVTAETDHREYSTTKVCPSDLPVNFDRISAAVKGYLTRRLMRTEKVQSLIQTIKDTMECALKLHEMARSNAVITRNDAELHQRLINQVTSACHAFHNVFFKYSIQEQMALIAKSRQLAKEKAFKSTHQHSRPRISSATVKSLQRKSFLKSKSVSPNTGRRKWKEPKRPSTAMEDYEIRHLPVQRKLSLTPVRERYPQTLPKGDSRSPSFYV